MTNRVTISQTAISRALAAAAKRGVGHVEMVAPDGTKIIIPTSPEAESSPLSTQKATQPKRLFAL